MSDSEAKTDKASPRKLQKQREEGSVAQAAEGGAFLAMSVLIIVMLLGFTRSIELIRGSFQSVFISMQLPFEAH